MNITTLKSIIVILIVVMSLSAKGQLYTGGNMGASYNDGYVLELAPLIGYKYLKIVESGASPFFSYAEKHNRYSFGARIFSQVTVYKETFVHAELEVSNIETYANNVKTRKWLLAMPVGGGYRYEISKGVFAYGMILYNVFQNANSHTKNPIIRGGITYQL